MRGTLRACVNIRLEIGYWVAKEFTVYLVDDDLGVLKALSRLLRTRGYDVKPYSTPQLFLEEHDGAARLCHSGCFHAGA